MVRKYNGNKIHWTETLEKLSKSISLILIPIAVVLITNIYTQSESNQKIRSEYIKIGVNILSKPPTDDNTELRQWAINLINKYSEIKFSKKAEVELRNNSINLFRNELDPYYSSLFPNSVYYTFSWDVIPGAIGYDLEIQAFQNGNWVDIQGICTQHSSNTLQIPKNTKIRWRVKPMGSSNYSNWKALYIND